MSSANAQTPILEARGLYVGYTEDVDTLRGVDLRVYPGEMVAVIGPNGAGKSTLIKAVAGLLRPRKGEVWFNGANITRVASHRLVAHGLAYVPQLGNIFPSLTVRENLEMGAYAKNGGREEMLPRITEWFPDLEDMMNRRAGALSGGQRQMVAMGRALMAAPITLMLDEPSAGLAPTVVRQTFDRVKSINNQGISIVLVEQNARSALAMSDRGYVLELGQNRTEGAGTDLLSDPRVAELYLGRSRGPPAE